LFLLDFMIRYVRDVGVAGSNPVTPTIKIRINSTRSWLGCHRLYTRGTAGVSVLMAFASCYSASGSIALRLQSHRRST
jgi:hypothetical protein